MKFTEKQRPHGDNGMPVQVLPTPTATPAGNWRWKKRAGTRFQFTGMPFAHFALSVFPEPSYQQHHVQLKKSLSSLFPFYIDFCAKGQVPFRIFYVWLEGVDLLYFSSALDPIVKVRYIQYTCILSEVCLIN